VSAATRLSNPIAATPKENLRLSPFHVEQWLLSRLSCAPYVHEGRSIEVPWGWIGQKKTSQRF